MARERLDSGEIGRFIPSALEGIDRILLRPVDALINGISRRVEPLAYTILGRPVDRLHGPVEWIHQGGSSGAEVKGLYGDGLFGTIRLSHFLEQLGTLAVDFAYRATEPVVQSLSAAGRKISSLKPV